MSRITFALRWLLFPLIAGAILFGCAGRWNLPGAWGVLVLLAGFGVALALTADEGLLEERQRPGPGSQDRLTRPASLVAIFAQWVIAGLDARYGWSPVPLAVVLAAVVGYAVCLAGILAAMRANRFYSSVVRVQSERGHSVITRGPYAIVRHPGYAASMLGAICGGLALGSWLAMIPTALFAALFVRRTLLEDRLLIAELPGYADYARHVRYRLIPGVL